MGIFDTLSKAYLNGKKAGEQSVRDDWRRGKSGSVGKAAAKGAGAAVKAQLPSLLRTFARLIKF